MKYSTIKHAPIALFKLGLSAHCKHDSQMDWSQWNYYQKVWWMWCNSKNKWIPVFNAEQVKISFSKQSRRAHFPMTMPYFHRTALITKLINEFIAKMCIEELEQGNNNHFHWIEFDMKFLFRKKIDPFHFYQINHIFNCIQYSVPKNLMKWTRFVVIL